MKPEIGSRWRSTDQRERDRVVEVLEVDPHEDGYVTVRRVKGAHSVGRRSKVARTQFSGRFEPEEGSAA